MISEDCFFIVVDSALICWDFKAHKQYELSSAHAQRLIFLIANPECVDQTCAIDRELMLAGIVKVSQESSEPWGWDVLSRIYHFGTKNIPLDDVPGDETAWAKLYLEHCEGAWQKQIPSERQHLGTESGILLPSRACEGELEKVLARRSTSRKFLDTPLRLDSLAKLLQYTFGFVDEREIPEKSGLPDAYRKRRCSPSGGGLN